MPGVSAVSLSSRLVLILKLFQIMGFKIAGLSPYSQSFEFLPVPSRKTFAELGERGTVTILCRKHKVLACGVCANHWDKVPSCFVAVVAS